jgi:hypothetical protein
MPRPVSRVELRVLDELELEHRCADRHEARITKTDGSSVVQEVSLFASLADDGRFSVVNEVTQMLHGSEEDRSIGVSRSNRTAQRYARPPKRLHASLTHLVDRSVDEDERVVPCVLTLGTLGASAR